MRAARAFIIFVLLATLSQVSTAQTGTKPMSSAALWSSTIAEKYLVYPDVVYGTASNVPLKLDVWQRKDTKAQVPTLIYYHGGGWIFGDRTGATLYFLPYLEMGWNVINVEYRMASTSLAPAAVEDCRCALRWTIQNAKNYNIDINKIVLTGHSAGGHLSLISGMLPSGTGLDNECFGKEELKVAAIVNWFGISDVADLLDGPNWKNYALMWMGSQPNSKEIARRVSPLTYVRKGLPPIFSVHGDSDPVVPYSQAVRLHAALDKAGVPNQLVTIHGGGHGQFTDAELEDAYAKLREFLKARGLLQ
jgi:acetyl esterase/lipase